MAAAVFVLGCACRAPRAGAEARAAGDASRAAPADAGAEPAGAIVASMEAPPAPDDFTQEIPGTTATIRMIGVPASPDGAVGPLLVSATEVTWDVYDVFVYALDAGAVPQGEADAAGAAPDAFSRPSKPYLPPDRGYGHDGYAAISVAAPAAQEFCKWLSARTGRSYRLPTEDEWEWVYKVGGGEDPARAAAMDDYAWHAGNSGDAPHPVASRKPSSIGVHDLDGNVAEWVVGRDGTPVTRGGSFRDAPDALGLRSREPWQRAWQMRDPQVPKSKWWLSDGPHVGFRVVCDP